MIHLFLGTKAQTIKTAPVIWELEAQGIPFRLIDAGQHATLAGMMRKELNVREPDVALRSGPDLATVAAGLRWLTRWTLRGAIRPAQIRRELFGDHGGICLVHGDTASTWLGAWLAQRAGLRVAHLEAGLRSYHLLSPFPEELCRRRTSAMSDLLLAPSAQAAENLKRMRVRGSIVDLKVNTGMESALFCLKQPPRMEPPWPRFVLALIHRMETLFSKQRLAFVAKLLLRVAREDPVLLLLHEPTRQALTRSGWMKPISTEPNLRCRPLVPYPDFLHLLRSARFVLSDGGSVQEESFYLNIPCLILRDRTERPEGLDPPGNVRLARWSWERVEAFLKRPEAHRRQESLSQARPSRIAVEALRRFDPP